MFSNLLCSVSCRVEASDIRDERSINIEGYSWFGNNRKSISKRALRGSGGSGGVGVLVKQSVLNQCDVATVTDK